MDPLRFLSETHGFFTRAQAREFGYDDRDCAAMMRHGRWTRIRRGYYTFPDLWPEFLADQHRVRARCAADSLGENVCLSHVTALLEHEVDVWGMDLSHVHVTRLDGRSGGLEHHVVHHVGDVVPSDVVQLGDLRVTELGRAVLEAGSRTSPESALVAMESALRTGQIDLVALQDRFEHMQSWPEHRRLQIPIRLATGDSQSVGESRGKWLFWRAGLPKPRQQFEVRDSDGNVLGVTDWAWPEHRTFGEFDGRSKYGRYLRPGESPGDAVFREKQREDAIRRATGFTFVRMVWSDLAHPVTTASRFRAALQQGA